VHKAISLRLKRADSTADVLAVIGEHWQRFNEVRSVADFLWCELLNVNFKELVLSFGAGHVTRCSTLLCFCRGKRTH
jgi:hypothetical protein